MKSPAENDQPANTPDPAPPELAPSANWDEPMLYCPVCSLRLESLKCKLYCRQCGYYMSCADYY